MKQIKLIETSRLHAHAQERYSQAGTLYKHRLQSYRNIVYTF